MANAELEGPAAAIGMRLFAALRLRRHPRTICQAVILVFRSRARAITTAMLADAGAACDELMLVVAMGRLVGSCGHEESEYKHVHTGTHTSCVCSEGAEYTRS